MKYKLLLLIVILLHSIAVSAQSSLASMEAQYNKTTDKINKMNLAYQIAEKALGSSTAKASKYANDAFNLANEVGDKNMRAKAWFLNAQSFLKSRDVSGARTRFERAKDYAIEAGDTDFALKCFEQLEELARKERNYTQAYNYSKEAVTMLRGKTKSSGSSSSSGKANDSAARDRNRLLKEKEEWMARNQELQARVQTLERESGVLRSDKQQFQQKEKKLIEQTEQVKQQYSAKQEEFQTVEQEKKKYERNSKEKQRLLHTLTKESLADSLMIKQQQSDLATAELKVAQSNRLRDILVIVSLGVLALAGLFYKRFVDNRKAKRVLEDKNKVIQEERERSDELLLNILPAPIAQELKENGKAKARRYEQSSVLFTDFINFTQIAEQLTPEELIHELDHCFKAFDFIISQYSIEKIKTIGDAYMCASGLSDSHHAPAKLVKAALEIQEFLIDLKAEKIRNGLPYFEARIGINTGPVVAGVVGVNKFAYDIWGDTVNIAARLESNCEPGKVNISESTYWQVKYDFKCQHRGKIAAKNKGFVDMYYVEKLTA